jgi:hypothetical protein
MLMRSCKKGRGNMEQEVKTTKKKKLNTQQLFGDGKEKFNQANDCINEQAAR